MPKDFDQWNTLKKQIDENKELSGFSEREVWWCRLGHNIGFEEDGKNLAFSRPILILRKFNKHFFYGVPLSTHGKTDNPYYYRFEFQGNTSYALLSQVRAFDAKRLTDRMGEIPESTYNEVLEQFLKLFAKK